MKNILSIYILLFISISAFPQNDLKKCGSDEMRYKLTHSNPILKQRIYKAEQELESFTAGYQLKNKNRKKSATYIIPIVFHVVHNYGEENIGDEQIYDQLNVLNVDFRKLNDDTAEIVQQFKDIAADCEIEFRLAQKDPDGNCTNGITRTVSELTAIGDHSVKELIQWPPDKYLNVWVCREAAGLAGHALWPADADTIAKWDGIVMVHNSIGSVGTSSPLTSTVLTHEIGHYLNLQHTWGGNNLPDFPYLEVGKAVNCNHDDGVSDTPNTIGNQFCNLSATNCGSLDNQQNYMEYSYCAKMFTEGQKQRMHAALNSTIANRNNLWQTANLEATGVNGNSELCEIQITANKRTICVGESVEFSDLSYHGILTRNWSFIGADITSSQDSTISVSYANEGTYDVQLSISDGTTSIDSIFKNYITVLSSIGQSAPFSEDFENDNVLARRWDIFDLDADIDWKITDKAAYSGTKSLVLENSKGAYEKRYEIASMPIDISGFTDITLSFDYAFAKKESTNNERLILSYSNDCGETWSIKGGLAGGNLTTASDTNGIFIPTATQWKKASFNNIPSTFFVENFRFKITLENSGGNDFYVDNIRFNDYPVSTNSINKKVSFFNSYFDNKNLNIDLEIQEDISMQIELIDISGRKITSLTNKRYSKGWHYLSLPIHVRAGIYLIYITNEENINYSQKIIKH